MPYTLRPMAATVFVKPSRLRAPVRRHPWIYGDSVARVEGEYANGDAVAVRAPDGKFLAWAFVNDASRLFLRLVSFEREAPPEEALLRARVRDAVSLRQDVLRLPERADAYRLIHSEGDGLPGLVVDRYGDVLVLSCSALGTRRRLETILDELEALLRPRAVLDAGLGEGIARSEGLEPGGGLLRGALPTEGEGAPLVVTVDGLRLRVPLGGGQKTGLFLDQRDNVRLVAALAPGRRVLDACCYVGTFGLACARAGAARALLFDSSAEAVAEAQANARLNEVAERVEVRKGALYRELHALDAAGERFDLIVLDPPKFARVARDRERARKGYLDANLLAQKLLAPGGLLYTCSCSHHMDEQTFQELLREAATRSGADLRLLDQRGAGPDHPSDLHCPEGRYLKGFLLQRRGSAAVPYDRGGAAVPDDRGGPPREDP